MRRAPLLARCRFWSPSSRRSPLPPRSSRRRSRPRSVSADRQPGLPDEVSLSLSAPPAADAGPAAATRIRRTARSCASGRPTRRRRPSPASPRPPRPSSARSPSRSSAARSRSSRSISARASPPGRRTRRADVSASTVKGLTVLGQHVTPSANAHRRSTTGAPRAARLAGRDRARPPRSAQATATGLRVQLIADHGGLARRERDRGRQRRGDGDGRASGEPAAGAAGEAAPKPLAARPVAPARCAARAGQVDSRSPSRARAPAPEVSARLSSRRLRLPRLRPGVVRRQLRRAARGRRRAAGITARTSSPRSGRPCSRSRTDRSTRSASTASAATASGSATTTGNEFYYAHLSAYSPLAVEGARSRRAT